ncbi:MAG: antitoxin family protein [Phycisphaerales bacterium]
MEFRGIYQDGVIRPTEAVNLPEGTEVEFHAKANGSAKPVLENWQSKSVEALAREQGITGPTSLDDLRGAWPEEDDIDEFLDWLRASRGR